jgi:hypothetical protein
MSVAENAWTAVDGLWTVDEDDVEDCWDESGLLDLLDGPDSGNSAYRAVVVPQGRGRSKGRRKRPS